MLYEVITLPGFLCLGTLFQFFPQLAFKKRETPAN